MKLEPLESREVPAAFVGIQGDTLAVALVGPGPHAVVMSNLGQSVQVTADFGTWAFPKSVVKQVVVAGAANSPNFILDSLDVPALLLGGSKADAIVTTGARSTVIAGGGADAVVATMNSVVFADPFDAVVRVPAVSADDVFAAAAVGLTPERAAVNAAYAASVFSQPSQFTDLFGPVTG